MAGLLDALRQYIQDAAPGGALNQEQPTALSGLLDYGKKRGQYIGGLLDPQSQISQDAQNWHKRTQLGLADQLAGRQTPAAEQAYQTLMGMAGIAPVGMIAYHGSPHKFDKFSLDKIGTGEGAQAYGHGLYLAEKPDIAAGYRERLSTNYLDNSGAQKAVGDAWTEAMQAAQDAGAKHPDHARAIAGQIQAWIDSGKQAKTFLRYNQPPAGTEAQYKAAADALDGLKKNPGNLYKTDIPDEAVARFLDWDKPLSQQKHIIDALRSNPSIGENSIGFRGAPPGSFDNAMNAPSRNGEWLYREMLGNNPDAAAALAQQGIPGIRYLDGGSRSAGQGSSNFVAFSPDLIRILERNGIATGEKPWAPGEWSGLLGK